MNITMKYTVSLLTCAILLITLSGCNNSNRTVSNASNDTSQPAEVEHDLTNKENDMKLFINDKEIPVSWESNDSVKEIMKDVANNEIAVEMSMYSDNEQVGSLGKKYTSNDKQTVTHNGDIVLYNSSNIVVFYGSNSWSYTRLGKMDLEEQEVTELLSNGNVTIKLR